MSPIRSIERNTQYHRFRETHVIANAVNSQIVVFYSGTALSILDTTIIDSHI